jgi:DNA-binding XRE family transcriptional regulator
MRATQKRDESSVGSDVKVRLRLEVYDALVARRGIKTVVAQAQLHGIGRQHMFDIRAARVHPSLPLAMRMATDLGTTVDALFEQVA